MGCDISEKESGIAGAGRGAFINALRSFDEEDSGKLNPCSFVTKVRGFARPQCRLSYSVDSITRELERVLRGLPSVAPSTIRQPTSDRLMARLFVRRPM